MRLVVVLFSDEHKYLNVSDHFTVDLQKIVLNKQMLKRFKSPENELEIETFRTYFPLV